MYTTFGVQKEEDENHNVSHLVDAIEKYFNENKVFVEPWEEHYYAIEFKDDEDKILFQAILKNE